MSFPFLPTKEQEIFPNPVITSKNENWQAIAFSDTNNKTNSLLILIG